MLTISLGYNLGVRISESTGNTYRDVHYIL